MCHGSGPRSRLILAACAAVPARVVAGYCVQALVAVGALRDEHVHSSRSPARDAPTASHRPRDVGSRAPMSWNSYGNEQPPLAEAGSEAHA
eukprot:15470059-Alexandrium_andersonii.AAC.1